MQRILNVAEKNDAAKTISSILSNGRCSNSAGASQYNRVYEFHYDSFKLDNHRRASVHMVFTSVSGHLLTVEFSQEHHKQWRNCRPAELFEAPVDRFVPENMKPVQRNLENLVRSASLLVLWTDCDREGENIGFEVLHVCRRIKPDIPVKRAKFSEMTPVAIQRAIDNLVQPDERLSEAVECRRELDLRIGAAFTRFQTLRLQKSYPQELSHQVVSFGPCQFPTLGFVVDRWREIEEFVREPFWKIRMLHQSPPAAGEQVYNVEFNWGRVRLFDEDFVNVICDECKDAKTATVTKVENRHRSKWRPVALDTVELEKAASRWLRINARETMAIAEKLYTSGFISYPRTETNIFPKNLDLVPLVDNLTGAGTPIGPFAHRVLQWGPNPRNGVKTDNAHPPIHPTKLTTSLNGNEKVVYEFIVRHFLACLSRDAIGQECKVEVKLAEEFFHASGLAIRERNYLDIYPYHSWGNRNLPPYERGQQFVPSVLEVVGGNTSPPNLLTEADLISLMENHGIGTDATHAEHIEKIKTREYTEVVGRAFSPLPLGIGLVEGYETIGHRMSKPELRAEMEVDFAAICNGLKTREQVLREQIVKYSAAFNALERGAIKLEDAIGKYFGGVSSRGQNGAQTPDGSEFQESTPIFRCQRCSALMYLKQNRRRSHPDTDASQASFRGGPTWQIACDGYPSCNAVIYIPNFALAVEVSQSHCQRCSRGSEQLPKLLNFRFKPGSVPPYFGPDYTGCVAGCNSDLLNLFREASDSRGSFAPRGQTQSTSSRSTVSTPRASTGRDLNSSRSRSRGASRGSNSAARGARGQRSNPRGQPTRSRAMARTASGSSSFSMASNASTQPEQTPNIDCQCNQPAVTRTVRKEGPNQGRQFFGCATRNCSFFCWAENPLS